MNITVILCTYNRCESLTQALESIAASVAPESLEWEVLVVDNNSSDQTRDVVADFSKRYPGRFRYVFESQRGKSYALNKGIEEAKGDILAFTDDDITVEPMWLQRLTAPLLDGRWAGCGGRILPGWSCPRPRWLPDGERHGLAPLAVFDLGLEAGPLAEPPFGVNMAFRKGAFLKYGGFRVDLGPGSGRELRVEDTEFVNRLLAAGEQLWYEPAAVVYHPVPLNRLRRRYFLNWWFDKGRGDIRAFGFSPRFKVLVAGVPLLLFRRLAGWTVRWMLALKEPRRFSNQLKAWYLAGQIVECTLQAHAARRNAKQPAISAATTEGHHLTEGQKP
jgi:glycosyltransferase involved in cell wall biosynthesis